jgi:protein-S-isoprenylcysteine O-methyltransferase Ste14
MLNQKGHNTFRNHLYNFELIISMLGFVPKHATFLRTFAFAISVAFSFYLQIFQPHNETLAFIYFSISEILYIGFIMLVLSRTGLRHWFRKKWHGAAEGFLAFEGVLGVLFFHNAVSLGYMASSTEHSLPVNSDHWSVLTILAILFVAGFLIKFFAAKVVSVDIYYWKDMFLGKKVAEFVVSGPYKYFSNPMYGIGQIPAYAAAIWYGSAYGLSAALLNQSLLFVFYYFFEKKFIRRIYLNNSAIS